MMGLLPDLRESRNGAHTARRDRVILSWNSTTASKPSQFLRDLESMLDRKICPRKP